MAPISRLANTKEARVRYTYECVLEREDDWWLARFPQLGEGVAQGRTREEALRDAKDLLVLLLAEDIEAGRDLPPSSHWIGFSPVSVDITPQTLEETHYSTIEEASVWLDMPESDIRELIASGELEAKRFGDAEKVSIDSLNRCHERRHQAREGLKKTALITVAGGGTDARDDAESGASKASGDATALQA